MESLGEQDSASSIKQQCPMRHGNLGGPPQCQPPQEKGLIKGL